MKKFPVSWFALLVLGALSAGSLRADYTAPTADPPFKMGSSIVGLEGWEYRAGGRKSEDTARLASIRWDEGRPAFILAGASIKNDFPKTQGTVVRVTLRVAFLFPNSNLELQPFRLLIGGAPFPELAFQANKDGGLGIGDGTGRKMDVLVPYKEIKPRSYYTITAVVDYGKATYDLSITGVKADDLPLKFERKEIAFPSANPGMQGMDFITASSLRVYINELSIVSE